MTDIEIKNKLNERSFLDKIISVANSYTDIDTKTDTIKRDIFAQITEKDWDDVDESDRVKRYSVTIYNKDCPSETQVVDVSAMSQELAESYAIKNGCMEGWGVLSSEIADDEDEFLFANLSF